MTARIILNLRSAQQDRSCEVPVRDFVIAGWTGRDRAVLEEHIRELADLGVTPPSRTPIFYRVAASLLTTAAAVDVIGTDSTGEVEFVLDFTRTIKLVDFSRRRLPHRYAIGQPLCCMAAWRMAGSSAQIIQCRSCKVKPRRTWRSAADVDCLPHSGS